MAKSLRSKQKNAARRKRRSETHYAAASKDMIERLSAKLLGADAKGKAKAASGDGDDEEMDEEVDDQMETGKKVSTSGPRTSGRDLWRARKGLKTKHGVVVLPAEETASVAPATASVPAAAGDDAEMDEATTKAERKAEMRRQENAKKMLKHKRKMAAFDGGVMKSKGFRPQRRR